jgi:uncharacterized protein (TIGR00255 family)
MLDSMGQSSAGFSLHQLGRELPRIWKESSGGFSSLRYNALISYLSDLNLDTMLKSMTGFGRAEQTVGDKTFLVDIKSLNGKQFELQLKLPAFLKPFEFEIRRLLSEKLGRGSLDCSISLKQTGSAKPVSINTDLAKAYYKALADLSADLNLDPSNILSTLVKLPEVITPTTDTLSDEEWQQFIKVIQAAVDDLNIHRQDEGRSLEVDLRLRISNIIRQQEEVVRLEPLRQQKIKEGLKKLLEEQVGKENFDSNRLEQEIIYYIEKIDISEEQVRLRNHCDYFNTVMDDPEEGKGKKLSFILQEIGREINTTGSKAYDATIQKLVVLMKDELEKAKEQVLNVL